MSTRRKLAIASWAAPREVNIYGKVSLDAGNALQYLDEVREKTGEKATVTHLVGVAISRALAAEPSLNGYIRLGRYYPHDNVALAFLVSLDEGADLAKVKIDGADQLNVVGMARALRDAAGRLRGGQDGDFNKSKPLIKALPTWALRRLVAGTGWLTSSMGMDAKALGLSAFPFGSAIITSVGMFGLDEAFVPPTPFARVPLYVLIGAIRDHVAAVDGQPMVRPYLTVTATIDHRFIDGFQGGVIAREFRKVFDDPWAYDTSLSDQPTTVAAVG